MQKSNSVTETPTGSSDLKIGHPVRFNCNDNSEKFPTSAHGEYLGIINDASNGDYNQLFRWINAMAFTPNSTFNPDIKVLEMELKDRKNISLEDKKKFFFNEETGEIVSEFRGYIEIIYMEYALFDFLNIGLQDLDSDDNDAVIEILKKRQNARIDNFINSVISGENNNAMLNNNFKTDYAECVADKNNFLRYMIYFRFLKEILPYVANKTQKLKLFCEEKNKKTDFNSLIKKQEDILKNLKEEIAKLNGRIERLKTELNKPGCLLEDTFKLECGLATAKRNEKIKEKEKAEKELQRLQHVKFILDSYGNGLESAQKILNGIQNSWRSAFENFIFHYMLEYPNTIAQLRRNCSFSMWDFVEFLLDHKNDSKFNRALYEIDKTKNSQDFKGDEDKKRTKILQTLQNENSMNDLNENQRKLVNYLFHDNRLKNSWMREAFRILFAGVSLFVIIAIAPLLAIIIPDIIMGLGALLAVIIGVVFLILGMAAAGSGATLGKGFEGCIAFLLYRSWHDMPWLTFKSIPIIPYYCSTFFYVAIPIAAVILIGTVAFYMYKKNQFDSVIRFTNLQMQQEKPPLELRLEEFRNARTNRRKQMIIKEEKPVRGEPVHSI